MMKEKKREGRTGSMQIQATGADKDKAFTPRSYSIGRQVVPRIETEEPLFVSRRKSEWRKKR
jgi:hypothetical protein